jgi:hypothetical protein
LSTPSSVSSPTLGPPGTSPRARRRRSVSSRTRVRGWVGVFCACAHALLRR